jgi:predicted amidophosphoribosyltransferase
MTEDSYCGILLGIILIVFPILAFYYGSDVQALWMFQDPFAVITMIIMGIIMIVSNKSHQESTPTGHAVFPQSFAYCPQCGASITSSLAVVPQSSAYCPQCGTPIISLDARFCAKCGRALPDYQSADMQ